MAASLDILKFWNRQLARMETLLQASHGDDAARAAGLAALVRELDTSSQAGICRLAGSATVRVCDARGQPRDDWAARIGADDGWTGPDGAEWRDLPISLEPGAGPQRLCLVVASTATPRPAAIGLLTPAGCSLQTRELLIGVARHLWLWLDREQGQGCVDEERRHGDVAEAAGVLHHELGNLLNNLVLDAAALERELADSRADRPREMRALVKACAERMNAFVNYRQSRRGPRYAVDLNASVRRAVHRRAEEARPRLQLAASLPPLKSTDSDLDRIVSLLLANAQGKATSMLLRTERIDNGLRLTVDDWGPPLGEDERRALFEPFVQVREGVDNLELAMCQSLVRRLNGSLRVYNRAGGGASFAIEFHIEAQEGLEG